MLLHDAEELDNDLRGWSDQDLSLSGLLGVVDGIERIVLVYRVSTISKSSLVTGQRHCHNRCGGQTGCKKWQGEGSVGKKLECTYKNRCLDHFGGLRFSVRGVEKRYLQAGAGR